MTAGAAGAEDALEALRARADPRRAAETAAYHKAPRVYLGLGAAEIERLVAEWRAGRDIAGRVALAGGLWDSDVHEARIAAAKLLTQARIPENEPLVWEEFLRWVPSFDAWAIADHACKAGERRLVALPARLDVAETWLDDPNKWVRRAALVATLPCRSSTTPLRPRQRRGNASSAGRSGWSPTATGSSRRRSPGGFAASPSTTPAAPAPFSMDLGRG